MEIIANELAECQLKSGIAAMDNDRLSLQFNEGVGFSSAWFHDDHSSFFLNLNTLAPRTATPIPRIRHAWSQRSLKPTPFRISDLTMTRYCIIGIAQARACKIQAIVSIGNVNPVINIIG